MIKIPPSVRVNTGEQSKVRSTIDDFLEEVYQTVADQLNLEKGNELHPYFEIKNSSTLNNENFTYLKYKDNVIAIVTKTRTEFNYVQYDFFLNLDNID